MSYGVLTLSTRTTFLDTVLYLEASTEQVPSLPSQLGGCYADLLASTSIEDKAVGDCFTRSKDFAKALLLLGLARLSFATALLFAAQETAARLS